MPAITIDSFVVARTCVLALLEVIRGSMAFCNLSYGGYRNTAIVRRHVLPLRSACHREENEAFLYTLSPRGMHFLCYKVRAERRQFNTGTRSDLDQPYVGTVSRVEGWFRYLRLDPSNQICPPT